MTEPVPEWRSKRIILIRHGRSVWNELLGAHKEKEWEEYERNRKGFRKSVKDLMFTISESLPDAAGRGTDPQAEQSDAQQTFLQRLGRRSSWVHTPADPPETQAAPSSSSTCTSQQAIQAPPNSSACASQQAAQAAQAPSSSSTFSPSARQLHRGSLVYEQQAAGKEGGFWKGVRGNVRKATHVLGNAGKLHQVDHSLSADGLVQARELRSSVAEALASEPGTGSCEAALAECRDWHVSPFLRALQTAAYALAPLYKRDSSISMRVTPEVSEIMSSNRSFDCQGKPGNVGVCVFTRAMGKIATLMHEEENDPTDTQRTLDRQVELADVCTTLGGMDYTEVASVWWKETSDWTRSDMAAEDVRIQRIVNCLLANAEPISGMVAHSFFFQRLIQLFWPEDTDVQEQLRKSMRNGASEDTLDPLKDKLQNCGVLLLRFRYRPSRTSEDDGSEDKSCFSAEISDAEFLFDGRMESGIIENMKQAVGPDAAEEIAAFSAGVFAADDAAVCDGSLDDFLTLDEDVLARGAA